MSTRGRRALAAVVALCGVLAAAGPAAATPTRADAGSAGACPSSVGVTVVVDFQSLGGGVNVRCAPSAVSSGFDALDKAGVDYDTVNGGGEFLCQIAGLPSTAGVCNRTPPANAYWSYWHADPGGTWAYSALGAADSRPAQGSFEGWSFSTGSSAAPRYGSEAPTTTTRPPATTTAPTTSPPTTAKAGTTTTAPAASPDTTATTRGAGPTTAPARGGGGAGGTTTSTSTAAAAPGQGASAEPTVPGADPTVSGAAADGTATTVALPKGGSRQSALGTVDLTKDASHSGSGSPAGALAGVGAVAVIGAGAALTARRRRSSVVTPLGLPIDPPDPPA